MWLDADCAAEVICVQDAKVTPTFREATAVAWFFTWRLTALNIFCNHDVSLLLIAFFWNLTGSKAAGVSLAWIVIAAIITAYVLLLRKFLNTFLCKRFRGFLVQLMREGKAVNGGVSKAETLKILWLFSWRGTLPGVLLAGVYGYLHPFEKFPPWLVLFVFFQPSFIGIPLAASVITRKRFSGFHFSIKRSSAEIEVPGV